METLGASIRAAATAAEGSAEEQEDGGGLEEGGDWHAIVRWLATIDILEFPFEMVEAGCAKDDGSSVDPEGKVDEEEAMCAGWVRAEACGGGGGCDDSHGLFACVSYDWEADPAFRSCPWQSPMEVVAHEGGGAKEMAGVEGPGLGSAGDRSSVFTSSMIHNQGLEQGQGRHQR